MATKAIIAVETSNGWTSVSCERDGYFEGVGETLIEFYPHNTLLKLIKYGDLLQLGVSIGPKGDEEACIFLERDLKQPSPAITYSDMDSILQIPADYYYFCYKDNKIIMIEDEIKLEIRKESEDE